MKKEMNNKGFSLVELIIVIAIMAVLVGILAPQYLKYVNNSKVNTDITNAQNVATAFNVAFADGSISASTYTSIPAGVTSMTALPDSKLTPGTSAWSIVVTNNGVSTITLNSKDIYPNPDAGSDPYGAQRH